MHSLDRRSALKLGLGLAVSTRGLPGYAAEGDWPGRPLRVVVNFPPAGAVDAIARAIGTPLAASLGQPVMIDNRAGAGGAIGADLVAKAAPDGYTLLVSAGTLLTIGPHVYAKLPLDPMKDLVPVAAVSRGIQYLLVRADLPVKDGREFLAHLEKNSSAMTYGSPGSGTGPHLAGEMLKARTNTQAVHVPYKGAAPAIQDLLAGRLDYLFDPGVGLAQLPGGKVRLLAIGGPKRIARFAGVPTLAELGVRNFDAESIFGVYAPARTPAAVVGKLNTEINKLLAQEAVRTAINANGAEVADPLTPEAFMRALRQESERFGAIVRERNIRAD
jgi:tripartite-type tricarboxylate transporter receptor subunit TctC